MTRSLTRAAAACGLFVAAVVGSGCGIFKSSTSQASVESSSRSSSSPFKSSSASSGDEAASALARDVTEHSASWARSGGDLAALQREVGTIAQAYGVVDWEGDPGIHRAMGRGFHAAGLDADRVRRLGTAVSGGDGVRVAWVLAGHAEPAVE